MSIDLIQAFTETPPPLDFVLPGLLAGTIGSIVSPGGAGKSMLALELAILVATGRDLAGIGGVSHTGPVAFLAAEDPAEALRHRLYALGQHLTSAERLHVAETLVVEPTIGSPVDAMEKEGIDFIEALARGRRLLFLDTLRRFHNLDENDSGSMARLIGQLETVAARTRCTIVFLHHASKAAALSGQGDMQQASRGSSVLADNIRWQMFLAGATRDEARDRLHVDEADRGFYVRCGISKRNYGMPAPDHWLRRSEGGVLVSAQVQAPEGSTSKRRMSREAD